MESPPTIPKRLRSFRPAGYRVLEQEQIETLHAASLEIMERTGMRFFDQEAVDLFKKAVCRISDGNIVHIPSNLVDFNFYLRIGFTQWYAAHP